MAMAMRKRHFGTTRAISRWTATPLPHRSLIKVTGPASTSFLQGLVTNDLSRLGTVEGDRTALATAFLTAQGRTLFDAFVVPTPDGKGYWIDHPRFASPEASPTVLGQVGDRDPDGTRALWLHLRRYLLRKQVQLGLEDRLKVWSVWNTGEGDATGLESDASVWRDGRAPGMGYRALVPNGEAFPPAPMETTDPAAHTLLSILHSLPPSISPSPAPASSPADASTSHLPLPLELCLDLAHAVDFRKGCYVGQELTARTKWTGVVRKRLACVSLSTSPSSSGPPTGSGWTPLTSDEVAALPSLPGPDLSLFPLSSSAPSARRRSGKPRPWGTLVGPSMYCRSPDGKEVKAVALAVVRVEEALGGGEMCVGFAPEQSGEAKEVKWYATAERPAWWPAEADVPT